MISVSRSSISVFLFVLFFLPIMPPQAIAETCVMFDPADTGVNIRATPNGRLINRLRNGRRVTINEIGYDGKGRPWARVSGFYQGRWRYWGWAFMDLMRCR